MLRSMQSHIVVGSNGCAMGALWVPFGVRHRAPTRFDALRSTGRHLNAIGDVSRCTSVPETSRDRDVTLGRFETFFDSHSLSAMLAAHVVSMSTENSNTNPFELWDETELATRLGVPVTTVES